MGFRLPQPHAHFAESSCNGSCKQLQARWQSCIVRIGTELSLCHLAEQVAVGVLQVPKHAVQAAPAAKVSRGEPSFRKALICASPAVTRSCTLT